MKMKKLLAVVLTGVMAMSVLTGCADIKTRQIADQLEGMLKSVNTKATVSATNDAEDLAKKAAKAVQKDDVDFGGSDAVVVVGADESESTPAKKTEKAAITEALKLSETKDKYVWVLRFDTKNLKNADQAKKIFDKVKSIDNALNAVDNFEVTTKKDDKEETKTYKAMAGDKYEIGTETFSKGEGKDLFHSVHSCSSLLTCGMMIINDHSDAVALVLSCYKPGGALDSGSVATGAINQ